MEFRDYTHDTRPIPGIEEVEELAKTFRNGVEVTLWYVKGTLTSFVTVDTGDEIIRHPVPEGENPMNVFRRPGQYHEEQYPES